MSDLRFDFLKKKFNRFGDSIEIEVKQFYCKSSIQIWDFSFSAYHEDWEVKV